MQFSNLELEQYRVSDYYKTLNIDEQLFRKSKETRLLHGTQPGISGRSEELE
jgi:hypothetical protein